MDVSAAVNRSLSPPPHGIARCTSLVALQVRIVSLAVGSMGFQEPFANGDGLSNATFEGCK